MSHDLPEEVLDFLIEERSQCLNEILDLSREIDRLTVERNKYINLLLGIRAKHSEADRRLAMATKLTVVDVKRKTTDPNVRALEKVLANPEQAQALIDLLREVQS